MTEFSNIVVSKICGSPDILEVLSILMNRRATAGYLSETTNIPLSSVYSILKKLTTYGVIKIVDYLIAEKRTAVYLSTVSKISVEVTHQGVLFQTARTGETIGRF